jgi:hypothetical protein
MGEKRFAFENSVFPFLRTVENVCREVQSDCTIVA